jgi:hypothetical protein
MPTTQAPREVSSLREFLLCDEYILRVLKVSRLCLLQPQASILFDQNSGVNYNLDIKDLGKRPGKSAVWIRRPLVVDSFRILYLCTRFSNAYTFQILISELLTALPGMFNTSKTAKLLLALASTMILGSEYHGTHGHILISDGS